MQIFVYNKSFRNYGIVDNFISFIWTKRYSNVGEFAMIAPNTKYNFNLLQEGRLIYNDEDNEAAEITYSVISEDDKGQEIIECKGKMIFNWLDDRVAMGLFSASDTPNNIIKKLVNDNAISPVDTKRKMPISQVDITNITTQITYGIESYYTLLTRIVDLLNAYDIGAFLAFKPSSKTPTTGEYIFTQYLGADRTQKNKSGNEPVIFSVDFDDVLSQKFETLTDNYKNFAYVGGETQNDLPQQIVTIDNGFTGLDRKEVYIDGSSLSSEIAGTILTPQQYTNMLKNFGVMELAKHIICYVFDSTIKPDVRYKYGIHYKVGDIVTCSNLKWGVTVDLRITEIILTYEGDTRKLQLNFGDGLPTVSQKLKQKGAK